MTMLLDDDGNSFLCSECGESTPRTRDNPFPIGKHSEKCSQYLPIARQQMFFNLLSPINRRKNKIQNCFIFNCGKLGICRIYWCKEQWQVEWHDKVLLAKEVLKKNAIA